MLKTIIKIIAILLAAAGVVFFLQGVNVLPGSYMTGDPQWAINGAVMALVGIVSFWFVSRKKP